MAVGNGMAIGIPMVYLGSAAPASFLLDDYPNIFEETVGVSYSLRNLFSTYTESKVVQVRRGSDGNDSGFSAADVANGTMRDWVNAEGNEGGYVTTWFDQNGNYNLEQSNANNQPIIVYPDTGAQVMQNGKPAIDFTKEEGISTLSNGLIEGAGISNNTVFMVNKIRSTSEEVTETVFQLNSPDNNTFKIEGETLRLRGKSSSFVISATGAEIDSQALYTTVFAPSAKAGAIVENNGPLVTGDTTPAPVQNLHLAFPAPASIFQGSNDMIIQEFILYPSAIIKNPASLINTAINGYYNIY